MVITDGRTWLEEPNSQCPRAARIRFVSSDLAQENVSSLLVCTKSVNRSVRTNHYDHPRIYTVQLHLETHLSGPDSRQVMSP